MGCLGALGVSSAAHRARPSRLVAGKTGTDRLARGLDSFFQQQGGLVVLGEPLTKLREHRGIPSRIVQLLAERILPSNAVADRFGRLPVGQAFKVLKADDQGQPPGLTGGLSGGRIQSDKVFILVETAQPITHTHDQGPLGVDFPSQPLRFGWDRSNRLWIHRHWLSPCSLFHSVAPSILLFFSFASRVRRWLPSVVIGTSARIAALSCATWF